MRVVRRDAASVRPVAAARAPERRSVPGVTAQVG